jgi:Leucine-rich repeat (LRR) protein
MSDEAATVRLVKSLGGTVEVDCKLPGRPVVAVGLSFNKFAGSDLKKLQNFKHLRELDLSFTKTTDEWLKIVAAIETLEVLDLSQTKVRDAGLNELTGCKHLHTLKLADDKITNAGLQILAECTKLRSLALSFTKITDAGLKFLAPLKQLQELDVGYTNLTDAGLKVLGEFQNLRELDIGALEITTAGLRELQRLRNLRSLDLTSLPVTKDWFDILAEWPTLRKLEFNFITGKPHLQALMEVVRITNLEELNFQGTKVTDALLEALAALPNLKTLGLFGTKIKDSGLKALRGCKHLQELDLSDAMISNAGLKELRSFAELRRLHLSETKIGNSGLQELSEIPTLEELNLTDTKISDTGIVALTKLENLRSLELSRTRVTDTGVSSLKALPNLERLWLADTDVTDACLGPLRDFEQLQSLCLNGASVTPAGVEALQSARPELEITFCTKKKEDELDLDWFEVEIDLMDEEDEDLDLPAEAEISADSPPAPKLAKITESMSLERGIAIARTYPLEALVECFKTGGLTVWRSAEEVLAERSDPQTMPRLLELLNEELEATGDSTWFRVIQLRLNKKVLSKEEKRLAVAALVPLVHRRVRKGELEPVAGKALEALAEVQPLPPKVAALCSAKLKHPSYTIASSALRALVNLPPRQRNVWVPTLLKHVNGRFSRGGNSEGVWIIECLAPHFARHRRRITPVLRAGLKSKHAFIPRSVLQVLRQIGRKAAGFVPDVLGYIARQKAYTNEEPHLIHIDPKGKHAIRGLIHLLGSRRDTARYQAICELEAYGPLARKAIPALTKLAGRKTEGFSAEPEAAQRALHAIQP